MAGNTPDEVTVSVCLPDLSFIDAFLGRAREFNQDRNLAVLGPNDDVWALGCAVDLGREDDVIRVKVN